MTLNPSTNFKVQKEYQNELKFSGVYSRNNIPKIENGSYVINLHELKSAETCWIALHVNGNNVIYSDIFGVCHIPKEIKKFLGRKNIITNCYRIQAYDSMMCG